MNRMSSSPDLKLIRQAPCGTIMCDAAQKSFTDIKKSIHRHVLYPVTKRREKEKVRRPHTNQEMGHLGLRHCMTLSPVKQGKISH